MAALLCSCQPADSNAELIEAEAKLNLAEAQSQSLQQQISILEQKNVRLESKLAQVSSSPKAVSSSLYPQGMLDALEEKVTELEGASLPVVAYSLQQVTPQAIGLPEAYQTSAVVTFLRGGTPQEVIFEVLSSKGTYFLTESKKVKETAPVPVGTTQPQTQPQVQQPQQNRSPIREVTNGNSGSSGGSQYSQPSSRQTTDQAPRPVIRLIE